MVNHGLSTGGLFLIVGMVYERTHSRELADLGGLSRPMPWLAGCFLVIVLSSLGLPGLNNFVGEFLVVLGTLLSNRLLGVLAASGIVLAAIYLLWSYQRAMLGAPSERNREHRDLSLREAAILAPVLALLLVFGLQPNLLLDRITPTTSAVVQHVQSSNGGSAVAAAGRTP
jgi:NADH-quinone oxidoreductase subunit M